jgi:8-oxo-dGTP pyrophosphatase MutT (NUDIX family)
MSHPRVSLGSEPRERHKAIAIPMSIIEGVPHFLIVHDRRYREWTFVTGGCRRREVYNPLRCAVRELEEETRGLINLKRGSYSSFKFTTDTPEPRDVDDGVTVLNHYHVYLFNLPMSSLEHRNTIRQFMEERRKMEGGQVAFRKNYDENDECRFENIESISKCPNLWPMIRRHVLGNQEFHQAVQTTHWKPFNLVT